MIIEQGKIPNLETSTEVNYSVQSGISATDASEVDSSWLTFTIAESFNFSGGDPANAAAIFDEIHKQTEHGHWNWERKLSSMPASGNSSYECFSLDVGGESQALMLIRYPHPSRCCAGTNIVYVDYLQVAPWNLANKYRAERRFRGAGSLMLNTAKLYCRRLTDNYHFGFGLHSLPQSEGYYRALGLHEFGPDNSYHSLVYFESDLEEVV